MLSHNMGNQGQMLESICNIWDSSPTPEVCQNSSQGVYRPLDSNYNVKLFRCGSPEVLINEKRVIYQINVKTNE